MKVSIIIPSYTNTEGLRTTLETIEKYTDFTDTEVIVSLNGSPSESRVVCAKYLPNRWFHLLDCSSALGYSGACNAGIRVARGEFVVLLNDDVVLLPQEKNSWINKMLAPFSDKGVGITGPLVGPSAAGLPFAIFFCVMIRAQLFKEIGLLDEDFKEGAGEDSLFCHDASARGYKIVQVPEQHTLDSKNGLAIGDFPIYHKGEATVSKLDDWQGKFDRNTALLVKKCIEKGYIKPNDDALRNKLSNNCERAVISATSHIPPREMTRYKWAREHITGTKVLEIGCSSGFGLRIIGDIENLDYTGIDYDGPVIEYAKTQFPNHKFMQADVHDFKFEHYDTIICFECIEHLSDGKEIAQMLKKHCDTLLLTVPYKEVKGTWGIHHKLHGLNERDFPDFDYQFINEAGKVGLTPFPEFINLMMMEWKSDKLYTKSEPYVLAYISTRDRHFTTLPLTIQSIINQNVKPNKLIIYDDSETPLDTREMDPYKHLFKRLSDVGIDWEVRFSPCHGQVKNHENARNENADLIWRLDDDCYAMPTVLETLLAHFSDPAVGAVGSLILTPGQACKAALASGFIKDLDTHLNYQWCSDLPSLSINSRAVEHLHCSFVYRRSASSPYPELSKVGHREETWFTHTIANKGFLVLIDPTVITWHYRAVKGGIRKETDIKNFIEDEYKFRQHMKFINQPLNEVFWVVLDNAVGDHCVFASILPELKAKHANKHFIIACCYPDLFQGENTVSIEHAKTMLGGLMEKYNVYRTGEVTNAETLEQAFRRTYGLC